MRLLIQSAITWEFLHCHPQTGDVAFTPSLACALRFGVITDEDQAAQMIEDHCDKGQTLLIDLDQDIE